MFRGKKKLTNGIGCRKSVFKNHRIVFLLGTYLHFSPFFSTFFIHLNVNKRGWRVIRATENLFHKILVHKSNDKKLSFCF